MASKDGSGGGERDSWLWVVGAATATGRATAAPTRRSSMPRTVPAAAGMAARAGARPWTATTAAATTAAPTSTMAATVSTGQMPSVVTIGTGSENGQGWPVPWSVFEPCGYVKQPQPKAASNDNGAPTGEPSHLSPPLTKNGEQHAEEDGEDHRSEAIALDHIGGLRVVGSGWLRESVKDNLGRIGARELSGGSSSRRSTSAEVGYPFRG